MEASKTAFVKYSNMKHCFVLVPSSWSKFLQADRRVQVLEIAYGNDEKVAYFSWNGEYSATDHQECLEVNALLASKLGLLSGEEVLAKQLNNIPSCLRMNVEPLSPDDWEILELNAEHVQMQLLNQIRVVAHNQAFPIWINHSISIFVYVVDMSPSCARCCILEDRTEVVISPKLRKYRQISVNQSSRDLISQAKASNAKQLSDGTDNYSKQETVKTSQPNISYSVIMYIFNFLKFIVLGVDAVSGIERMESSNQSSYSLFHTQKLKLSLRVEPCANDYATCSFCDNFKQKTLMCTNSDCDTICEDGKTLRVHSCCDYAKPSLHEICEHGQFCAAFISEHDLPHSLKIQFPNTFVACVRKIKSPAEINRYTKESKQNLENLKNTSVETLKNEVVAEVSNSYDADVCAARIFVIDKTNEETVRNLGKTRICDRRIAISDLLRRTFGLGVTDKVCLESLQTLPKKVHTIILHPMFSVPLAFENEEKSISIIEVFKNFVSSCSSETCPVVLNSSNITRLALTPDFSGEFLLIVKHLEDAKMNESGLPATQCCYYFLTPLDLTTVEIKLGSAVSKEHKHQWMGALSAWDLCDLDPPMPIVQIQSLGGIAHLFKDAVDFLTTVITDRRLCWNSHCMGGLMICGVSGSGKTSLAKAVCVKLAEAPNYTYIHTVECRPLRGKRVEKIKAVLSKAVAVATFKQPSVLLLEDLDAIVMAPTGPEDDHSPDALYSTKVAEVIKDLIDVSVDDWAKLILMATAHRRNAVHSSLVSSRGHHLFLKFISIEPPDQVQRSDLLKAVISSVPCLHHQMMENLNLVEISQQTEGCNARDLQKLVHRAVHAAHRRNAGTVETENQKLLLRHEDFTTAQEGFMPLSLRGVSLHQTGELTWKDVGGLCDVKKALVETLIWPSKYPELFVQCPLRLRQGILLYGPPGCGKTLLAGVVAKECGLHFISIKGPELLSKYIGASEQAVRDVFKRAECAKPCVVFFDEFDAIAPRRGHDSTGVTDRVVNQLLTQLDGVEGLQGVYVLGATSRPDLIDPAFLRPGRLDKCLKCPMPSQEELIDILEALSINFNLADDVDLALIAQACRNFSGADLKALLYNAQLEAIHSASWRSKNTPVEYTAPDSTSPTVLTGSTLEDFVDISTSHEYSSNALQAEDVENLENMTVDPVLHDVKHLQTKVIQVNQSNLLQAVATTKPSVSEKEMLKYEMIYEAFLTSRSSNFGKLSSFGNKRITLA